MKTTKDISDEIIEKGREFDSGAYRDTDEGKFDYEAFLSPAVLESFAGYMHKNRKQSNGDIRDGDNWQKGLPKEVYMKSMWRHFHAVWKEHRGIPTTDGMKDNLNALLFNVMGYLFEKLKSDQKFYHDIKDGLKELNEQPMRNHPFGHPIVRDTENDNGPNRPSFVPGQHDGCH